MSGKPPGDNGGGLGKGDPIFDPEEPTRMVTPEMRPDGMPADDRSQTGSRTGTGTGTGTFGDLADLADGPLQVMQEGDTLKDRFVLETRLGTGGMGTVYKALDLRKQEAEDRNPYIAIKILNEDFRSHPESLRTLQRESKKAQSLAHPSIVTVYDFDRDGSSIYMTMEYLEGKPLDKITKSGNFKGLPFDQAMEIIKDVGAALSFAHGQGIVHCDFKPGNIFITETGPAKVIDFGIARAVKMGDDLHADATVFDAGTLGALTPAYASPEMLEEQEPDPRDDVYALACIAYELIAGRHPFGRMPATEARDNALVAKQPKQLNRAQWRALSGGLAFERDKRTASVKTFVEELSARGGNGKIFGMVAAVAGIAVLAGAAFHFNLIPLGGDGASEPEVIADAPSTDGKPEADTSETQDTSPPVEESDPAPTTEVAEEPTLIPPVTSDEVQQQEALALPSPSLTDIGTLVMNATCSDMRYSMDGNAVSLTGYSGAMAEINLLREKIQALPGVENAVVDVKGLDGALCGPLDLYAPFLRNNRDGALGLLVQARNPDGNYVEDENLIVDLRLPGHESYVYVDYYSIDGGVLHMLPNEAYPENLGSPDLVFSLGEADSARNWSIAAPFGTEIVVVLSSPVALFDSNREEIEFASGYLSALRDRLRQIESGPNGDRLAADVFFINTKPAQ